ncbi:MAG TPA: hypothetical protein VNQ73_21065 [Ilumatobacter sp.]|nr:hypothetical protein [Ilumatobacter sp.]
MSNEHKAAMEAGRAEGRAVRDYLEALRANKPRRGRKRTAESIDKRLAAIADELPVASAIEELKLVQERRDLEAERATIADAADGADLAELEARFVAVAQTYAERKGISYASWREVGVPAAVLTKAGIGRGA